MDGRYALAAIGAGKKGGHDQDHQSVIWQPSYGQINYYSPVLVALAREYRDPTYQRLALWDRTLGSIQQSRYITDSGEWMLFAWGGYAYAWYDPSVKAGTRADAPRSFVFPSMNEAYVRDSYEAGGIVAGMYRGAVAVHAGGRPVMVDERPWTAKASPTPDLELRDDGRIAVIRCRGAEDSAFASQEIALRRPGSLTLTRQTDTVQRWWCFGSPKRTGNSLRWPDGTVLEVKRGTIVSVTPGGYRDEKVVGLGLLRLKDPMPMAYPLVQAQPHEGTLIVEVRAPKR